MSKRKAGEGEARPAKKAASVVNKSEGKNEKKTETQTCEYCTFEGDEEPASCSICLRHLCKSVAHGQTACSPCLIDAIAKGAIKKNDKGQWLDPARQTPLKTCLCGAFMHPMNYDCFLKSIQGDPLHRLLQ